MILYFSGCTAEESCEFYVQETLAGHHGSMGSTLVAHICNWRSIKPIQGGADKNVEENIFFSMYRPSCLIEAYFIPEKKYLLVCTGLFANHLFNLNFIFLATA